jgi:hypothetical protein
MTTMTPNDYSKIMTFLQMNNTQKFDNACISHNINYNTFRDVKGNTFLIKAVTLKCKIETFKFLLDKGCDPNVENRTGYTILHYMNKIEIDVLEFFIENGLIIDRLFSNGDSIFHIIINPKTIKHIFAKGNIRLDIQNNHGFTPLHTFCFDINVSNIERFDYLLEHIDVNLQDHSGYTCIYRLLNNSTLTIELFNKLIEKNIDLTILSQNNWSILHHVCSTMCDIEWIKLFIAHGADPLIKTDDNETILTCICKNRKVTITEIEYLLSYIEADHYALYELYIINKLSIFEYLLNFISCEEIDKLLERIEQTQHSYHDMKDTYIEMIMDMNKISIK